MSTQEIRARLQQPYERSSWQELLRQVFGVKVVYADPQFIPLAADSGKAEAFELGQMDTQDGSVLGFYEVQMDDQKSVVRSVVGLREMLRKVYKYAVDGAVVVFVQGKKWRCSYISEIRQWNAENEEWESKATEPRRFTYLFGENEVCRTPAERFGRLEGKPLDLADVFEAFSVDQLNKEFFNEYRGQYEKFWKYLASNQGYRGLLIDDKAESEAKREKPIRDFVKLLLGRIVFLHFLQKKGWMGVPAGRQDWHGGDPDFLRTLFKEYPDKEHFLSAGLRALFFNTLNTRREGDLLPDSLGRSCKAPYLNGGLFDVSEADRHLIDFPASYFEGLLEFFSRYNFTIDENDPFEAEVGIDPEMLGRIFENLLEENREKGTFYTPKEIVHYMCQESLIQYLRSHLIECTEDHAPATKEVEDLIRIGKKADRNLNPKSYVVRRAKDIEKLLDDVKVCDPAIGSGAFPMGLLREIHRAKMLLDYTLDPADVKKHIIQNSIYGVDLERGAVDIARLRFWLALVVDEDIPQPLPNLDYKIMQGNSLLEQFEGIDLSKTAMFGEAIGNLFTGKEDDPEFRRSFSAQDQEDIKKLIHEYFDVSDRNRKDQIHAAVDKIVLEHINFSLKAFEKKFLLQMTAQAAKVNAKQAGLTAEQKAILEAKSKDFKELTRLKEEFAQKGEARKKLQELEQATERPYFLWHLFFKDVFDQGGFDIVIGNPPYLKLSKLKDRALESAGYQTYSKNGDIYCLFYELGLMQLKHDGILAMITSNSWQQNQYGELLRRYLTTKADPLLLLNFVDHQLFDTAVVETNILVARKRGLSNKLVVSVLDERYAKGSSLSAFIAQYGFPLKELNPSGWVIGGAMGQEIMQRMVFAGKKLENWDVEIYRGITTGLNEAFVIGESDYQRLKNEDPRSVEILKPTLRGRDLRRYSYSFGKQWMVFTHNGIKKRDIPPVNAQREYPAVFNHLKGFLPEIAARQDQGDHWSNLRNCAYIELFEKPKIIWGELSDEAKFTFDDGGHYLNNTIFMLTGEPLLFLLGVLNSAAAQWLFEKISTTSGMGTNRWLKYKIELLPVPEPDTSELDRIERLVKHILSEKSTSKNTFKWERKVDALVFNLYGLGEEEMNYVLDNLPNMSIMDKTQIQNEYRRIGLNQFEEEL